MNGQHILEIRGDIETLGVHVKRADDRIGQVEARLDRVEARLAQVEARLDRVEERLTELTGAMHALHESLRDEFRIVVEKVVHQDATIDRGFRSLREEMREVMGPVLTVVRDHSTALADHDRLKSPERRRH